MKTIERFSHLVSMVIERTEAVNALLQSKQRYALAMDATGDGHWDWKIANNAFYVSPLLLEMCGLPANTVIGTRAELMEHFPLHSDDRHRWEATTAAHLAGAGHFVKMVHNGSEYGLMAAYAED